MSSIRQSRPTLQRVLSCTALAGCLLGAGCQVDPTPLPTEVELAERDRTQDPPLYQVLYDTPVLPEQAPSAARVRQLVWLRHMQLSTTQLDRLADVHTIAIDRRDRMRQRKRTSSHAGKPEAGVYAQIWELMAQGTVDALEMNTLVDELRELQVGSASAILCSRLASLQAILDAEQAFFAPCRHDRTSWLTPCSSATPPRPRRQPRDFRALIEHLRARPVCSLAARSR